jgi:hypothetical protein
MRRTSGNPIRWVMLTVTATLIAGHAIAAQLDAKGERDLTALGQKVDKTTASGDSSHVISAIVDQWKGTLFKFDASSAPHELTAQHVQDLRQKKLGFGEISILLALTAKQSDPATAKSLNQILAMRQAGEGWGKLARDLGYASLGSVQKSVQATEEKVAAGAKPERIGSTEKADKPDKSEKVEKVEKPEPIHVEHPERVEKPGR